MMLKLDDETAQRLTEKVTNENHVVRLVYDHEGCGCAVSGVPLLVEAAAAEEGDVLLSHHPLPFYIWGPHRIFFAEYLQLKANPGKETFTLQSSSEIFSPHVRLQLM
ncbi:iron-sulfur cluster biosynthesis family protein [Bacillaceae bacterium SIJ1]|uniref:iron-sulfur cluster biosynthesis family protein n=1 Tax=Litoribacterium kuwaitense TaxID=1398745 RepID=UPI0013EBBAAC|nr:iron-sulfur cluster biosynthesis family protein [Litoribacterium kuwaitense]NGP43637.1 iron-sulfur cluster biosynthesis family protein [Litoribacterium kuwaitense]